MSGQPPPVVSKAAAHALRGLALGTSCSLLLLAEERRRRCKVAKKAVDNARQLRGLHHNTGFSAAVAFHELRNDDAALVDLIARTTAKPRKRRSSFQPLAGDRLADSLEQQLADGRPARGVETPSEPVRQVQRPEYSAAKTARGASITGWTEFERATRLAGFHHVNPQLPSIRDIQLRDARQEDLDSSSRQKSRRRPERILKFEQELSRWERASEDPGANLDMDAARHLVDKALDIKRLQFITRVSQVINAVAHDVDKATFDRWLLQRLIDSSEDRAAVDHFLRMCTDTTSCNDDLAKIGDVLVATSVRLKGYKADAMVAMLANKTKDLDFAMPSAWLVDLLQCHWSSLRNRKETESLIMTMISADIFSHLDQPTLLRCAIVDISLEYGDSSLVASQTNAILDRSSDSDVNPQLFGKLVVWKAKAENWSGLREGFMQMKALGLSKLPVYSETFDSCLAEYRRNHTWGEVESFIESYIREMDVPLSRSIISLTAERHASCRDIHALTKWLNFCRASGFTIDAALAQSIFTKCYESWRYGWKQAAPLYQLFKNLGLDIYDPRIERFMVSSNIPVIRSRSWLTEYSVKVLHQEALAKRGRGVNLGDEQTVYDRMQMELLQKRWPAVLSHYAKGVENGMGPTDRTLTLAVKAAVRVEGAGSRKALRLLQGAHAQNYDIRAASASLLLAQLNKVKKEHRVKVQRDDVTRTGYDASAVPTIVNFFQEMREHNIPIDCNVVDRATQICLRARQYRAAIRLCEEYAVAESHANACCNEFNFANLLFAYSAMHHYDKMGWLLQQLPDKDFKLKLAVRLALKRAKRALREATSSAKGPESRERHGRAYELVCKVHEEAKGWWKAVVGEREQLHEEMHRALEADSGYQSDGSIADLEAGAAGANIEAVVPEQSKPEPAKWLKPERHSQTRQRRAAVKGLSERVFNDDESVVGLWAKGMRDMDQDYGMQIDRRHPLIAAGAGM